MEDFEELLHSAHNRGIRIILDGVFNHCGRDFYAFSDVLENQTQSAYKDWFYIKRFPVRAYGRGKAEDYEAWWKFKSLPKLNIQNPEVRAYILRVAKFWLERGADGWRSVSAVSYRRLSCPRRTFPLPCSWPCSAASLESRRPGASCQGGTETTNRPFPPVSCPCIVAPLAAARGGASDHALEVPVSRCPGEVIMGGESLEELGLHDLASRSCICSSIMSCISSSSMLSSSRRLRQILEVLSSNNLNNSRAGYFSLPCRSS